MHGIVIGLVGLAGAGKDSLADYMIENFGVTKLGFSYALKELACEHFGYDFDRLSDLDYKEEQDPNLADGWTRRRVLQHIGTEGFRAVDPDHWVKIAMKTASTMLAAGAPAVVFADVRFMNEAAAIRALPQGYLWRVVRSDATTQATGEAAATHRSEQESERIVPHVTLSAEFGQLPALYAQGDVLARGIGLRRLEDA